jgi:hypothetical protein
MVFLGERATAAVLAGGVLVIAGVLVTGDSAAAEPRTGLRRSDLTGPTLHSRVRMPPPKKG